MREKILSVTALLIKQYGLRKFTVDEIAAELKISKKTVYKYFTGKEEIIHAYFEDTVASDQEGIRKALAGPADFKGKIRSVVHSTHKYPLPVSLLNEAKLFYPEEWEKVEELKKFKLESVKALLAEGEEAGAFKPGINFSVLCRMLQEVSEMFTDYDFLLRNKLTTTEAIDAALAVIFDGLLK
jgi:AcrR family transcriptional regulator